MITMDQIGWIRRLHEREGKSERQIARMTGLSRNTVAKWLRGEVAAPPRYKRSARACKLGPYEEEVRLALTADARRPKKERRTARALHAQLRARGYQGGYTRLTDFIRCWRASVGLELGLAYVPLAFELGEAFQFDWSEEGLMVGGIYQRAQVAHMKLCASRAFWLVAYPSQGHEMLFDAHARCFAGLGGVARRGIYDNMRTAVNKVGRGKAREVNARFAAMCAHYLFEADFCNVASGWEKGVVEKNVQDSRRRIWTEVLARRWGSFEELNAWLALRCRALWDELRHPEQGQFSIAEMLQLEREQLLVVSRPFDGYIERLAVVSSTCLVSVARNRYSVPCELARHSVSTRLYPERLVVVHDEREVASHARLAGRGETRYDWMHYVPLVQRKPGALRNGAPFADLPPALQKMRQALLRQRGGDRVMAQLLAVVPQAGLEAVLVACELALEGAPPSGRVSTEHVLNVLGRLSDAPAPETAATTLRVKTAPLADTARYDRLRRHDAQLGEQPGNASTQEAGHA
jgi:transposase